MFKLLNKQILKPMRIHNYHPVRRIGTTLRHNIECYKHDGACVRFARLEKEILGMQTRLGYLESGQKEMRAELKSTSGDLHNEMGKGFEGAEKRFRGTGKDFENGLGRSFERMDRGFDEMSERTDKGSDRVADRTDKRVGNQGKTFKSWDETYHKLCYQTNLMRCMAVACVGLIGLKNWEDIKRALRSSLL
ncbi:hypothetical protein HOY80DRAFT_942109 [Tuber brumale]|nr:hypothetical protein HOY80DRAFT_942109 [Tuber brumale]